jgi:hypothetical protein
MYVISLYLVLYVYAVTFDVMCVKKTEAIKRGHGWIVWSSVHKLQCRIRSLLREKKMAVLAPGHSGRSRYTPVFRARTSAPLPEPAFRAPTRGLHHPDDARAVRPRVGTARAHPLLTCTATCATLDLPLQHPAETLATYVWNTCKTPEKLENTCVAIANIKMKHLQHTYENTWNICIYMQHPDLVL